MLAGASVVIHNARADDWVKVPDLMTAEGVTSILLTPLVTRARIIGVLSLYTFRPYMFSEDEKQLMAAIGEQCSLAIDNAKMFAALKKRYESLVDEFQLWFEHTQSYSPHGSTV